MKRKNVLIITLLISVLLIVSTFGGTAVDMNTSSTSNSLDVIKEVRDDKGIWNSTIDAECGDTLEFRITVTYHNVTDPGNPHYAENIIVKDVLPSCLEYVSGSAYPFEPALGAAENEYIWSFKGITDLYDGESLIVTFNATVKEECSGEQINFAYATADEHCTGQTIHGNDYATVNVICPESGIDVEKKVWDKKEKEWVKQAYAEHDTMVRFNITVYNSGDCDLFDIYVNDTLPDELEYASGYAFPSEPDDNVDDKNLSWFFPGPFEPGDTICIEFNATLVDIIPGHIHVNWVYVTGISEEYCSPEIVTALDSAKVRVNGMLVEKEVRTGNGPWLEDAYAEVGDTVRFRIIIYYYGDHTLYDIHVEDVLPECLEYADTAIPKEPDDISPDGKTLTWDLEDILDDGGYIIIEFDADVNENNCEDCVNWAMVTAYECDVDILNWDDPATVHVICGLTADAGGPYSGEVNDNIEITGSGSGGSPAYTFKWDMDEDGYYDDATGAEVTGSWSAPGTHIIWLKVIDQDLNEATDYAAVTITVDNTKPNKPSISGPTSGLQINKKYYYGFRATDPDDDKVYLYIDWGDGNTEEWAGPYDSGETVTFNHSWSNSMTSYNIRTKAKDIHDAESDWKILTVQTPKNKKYYYPFLMKLLEHFPILQKLLSLPIFQQLLTV